MTGFELRHLKLEIYKTLGETRINVIVGEDTTGEENGEMKEGRKGEYQGPESEEMREGQQRKLKKLDIFIFFKIIWTLL